MLYFVQWKTMEPCFAKVKAHAHTHTRPFFKERKGRRHVLYKDTGFIWNWEKLSGFNNFY